VILHLNVNSLRIFNKCNCPGYTNSIAKTDPLWKIKEGLETDRQKGVAYEMLMLAAESR